MAESRIKDENYYQIQGWMINRLGLKGIPLSVYAIIYGFSQDGENEYTGSVQYLCDFCGRVSKPTIINALKELVEKKLLFRREEIINGVQFNRYKVNLQVVKNLYGGSKESLPGEVKNLDGGDKESLPNNKEDNKDKKENRKEIYAAIIGRLNERAGTNYKPSSKATQEYINGRLGEGYTVDDFFSVIDKKSAEWMGTKMEKYLRPQTLFLPSNFENYLNAPAERRTGANGVAVKTNDPADPYAVDMTGVF